jgi:hypothetical protein
MHSFSWRKFDDDPYDRRKSQFVMSAELDEIEKVGCTNITCHYHTDAWVLEPGPILSSTAQNRCFSGESRQAAGIRLPSINS